MASRRSMAVRRWFHLALALSLAWVQTVTTTVAAQGARTAQDRQLAERAAAFLRGVRRSRTTLDATRFDPEALARRFGEDWRAAFRFLRDEIALVPYRGTLRFARGTLLSRAGNACDRALLLAALLRPTGFAVRFARARLDADTVDRLRQAIDRPRTSATRPLAVDPFDPELAALFAPAGIDEATFREAVATTTERARALASAMAEDLAFADDRLRRLFADAPTPDPQAIEARVREALADHCWLQLETGQGWIDLDPSLPELEPGERLAEPATVSGTLPTELAPNLGLRVVLHRREGQERKSETLLEKRFALEDAFTELRLLVTPEIRDGRLAEALLAGEYREGFDIYVPVLFYAGGQEPGRPFGLDGRTVSEDQQIRSATRMGETVGDLFGGALGALSEALDEPEPDLPPESVFDGLELVLDMTLPDGSVRSARRLLTEPAPEEELRWTLFSTVDLLASASRVSRAFYRLAEIATFQGAKPLIAAALREAPASRLDRLLDSTWLPALQLWEFAHLRSVFGEYAMAEAFPDLVAVPDGPALFALHRRIAVAGDGLRTRLVYDLVFDRRRVLPRTAGDAADLVEAARTVSLLDNLLEHRLAGGDRAASGVTMLAAAEATGTPLLLLRAPAEVERLGEIPSYARARIAEALRGGAWIAAPPEPLEWRGERRFAYWRYDPATGSLLALGADGTGQAMAEYSTQIKLIAVGTVVGCSVSAVMGDVRSVGDMARCLVIGAIVGIIVGGAVTWLGTKLGWFGATAQTAVGAGVETAATTAANRSVASAAVAARERAPSGRPRGTVRGESTPATKLAAAAEALSGGRLADGVTSSAGGAAGDPVYRGTDMRIRRGTAMTAAAEPGAAAAPGRRGSASSAGSGEPGGGTLLGRRMAAAEEGGPGPGASSADDPSPNPPKGIPSELHGRDFEFATPTPKPPPASEQIPPSLRKIEHFKPLVEAVEATNLPMQEIAKLKTLARAHKKIIVTRKVNPHARRWYEQGAVGKDINMKGKSASRGAIAGLIPEDQAFSKLYDKVATARTEAERAAAWQKIAEYNAKVQKAVKEGGYEFVPFEVEGRKVGVYEKGNKVYQAYEKGGVLYDAATRRPIGDPAEFARIKDLRVVGKKVDGETRYVTADIDLDYVIENPAAPEQRLIKWKPEEGDTLGNRTPRQEALLEGARNLSQGPGDSPKILHGAEELNPFPEKLTPGEFPKLVVFDDGRVATLKNPYDQWKLLRDLKQQGYRIELSKEIREAYGWPDDWWQRMPDAVSPWAPGAGDRPRRRPPRRPSRRRLRRLPAAA